MDNKTNTVYCRVEECKYHNMNDTCAADEILINCHTEAVDSDNTLCQTFERGMY